MRPRWLRALLNLYPPYLGAGVQVRHISPDFRRVRVEMPLRWYNRNYVGTHFGGNLYSMIDPFYMLMLMEILGPDYIVWDASARIDFKRPGRGRVHADLQIDETDLEEVRRATATGAKTTPTWSVNITDEAGDVVARIDKTLYIRRKQR